MGAASLVQTVAANETSPETVLVDSELAAHAREQLDHPDDTIARIEREVRVRRLAALHVAASDETPVPSERRTLPVPDVNDGRRPRASLAVGTSTAVVIIALLFAVNADLRGSPGDAHGDALNRPTVLAPTGATRPAAREATDDRRAPVRVSHRTPAGRAAQQAAPRRFAWAPVPGASAYHVEFFRGDERVYAAQKPRAHLDLPWAWTFRGRVHRLEPGTYRWYVWPIVSGLRRTEATVQAELDVRPTTPNH